MHGHSRTPTTPSEFATPRELRRRVDDVEVSFKINLDIGHFTAPPTTTRWPTRASTTTDITSLHLKDRKKNQGDNVPWGQGDTPIAQVLQLLKKEKWPVRAYIECGTRRRGLGQSLGADVRRLT